MNSPCLCTHSNTHPRSQIHHTYEGRPQEKKHISGSLSIGQCDWLEAGVHMVAVGDCVCGLGRIGVVFTETTCFGDDC